MIGRKLAGRYEILESIGDGGMAVVYKARDTMLGRHVAVKVLRAQYTGDEDFVRRFRREAQAAASLSHQNIVNIYDVGKDGEDHFIVMEYVDGRTLKEKIHAEAPLPLGEALKITEQICDALDHAHQHQIIHRDIKPHNILLTRDGKVKVTDFGIARAISTNTITYSGSVIGSVHYFSPEQARGGTIDLKSDIYSLGVVLYEMLTGELPFSGESPISVALKHVQDQFVEPRQIRPEIPQSVENVILRAMAKDPGNRYASVKELREELGRALEQRDVPKFVPGGAVATDPRSADLPVNDAGNGGNHSKPRRKSRRILIALAWFFGLMILLGGGAIAAYAIFTHAFQVAEVQMPGVVGMSYDNAYQTLVRAGFDGNNIRRVDDWNATVPAGIVFAQDPEKGMHEKVDVMVTLRVSKGQKTVLMPDLKGKTLDDARVALLQAGIPKDSIQVDYQVDDTVPANYVIGQEPDANVPVIPGQSKVHLVVSQAEQPFPLPDLSGMTFAQAVQKLQNLGLKLGTPYNQPSYTVPPYSVIKSSPLAGSQVKKGDSVDLYVSSGYPPNARQATYNVDVKVDPSKAPVHVTVKVSDARGTLTVVDENISADKQYPINVVIQPGGQAVIDVYENNALVAEKYVPYQ